YWTFSQQVIRSYKNSRKLNTNIYRRHFIYLFIYLIAQPNGPSRATAAAATLATTQRQRSLSAARSRHTTGHLPFFQCNQCGSTFPRRCQQIPLHPSRTNTYRVENFNDGVPMKF